MCLCNGIDFTWRFNLGKRLFASIGFQRNTCENLLPILALSAKIGLWIWTVTQSLHTLLWLEDRFISHALFQPTPSSVGLPIKTIIPCSSHFPQIIFMTHQISVVVCAFFLLPFKSLVFVFLSLFFFFFSLSPLSLYWKITLHKHVW